MLRVNWAEMPEGSRIVCMMILVQVLHVFSSTSANCKPSSSFGNKKSRTVVSAFTEFTLLRMMIERHDMIRSFNIVRCFSHWRFMEIQTPRYLKTVSGPFGFRGDCP